MDDTVLVNLKEAIEKERMVDFIMGRSGYQIVDKLVETPTDLDAVFLHGFNKYSESKPSKEKLHEVLTAALIKLTETPVGLWWCIFIVYNYYLGFVEDALKFSFDTELVLREINTSILRHKEALFGCQEFVGYRFENGLWDNTINIISKLNHKFGSTRIFINASK